MIEFIAGMGCALFLIVFVGWCDVFLLKQPKVYCKDNPIVKYAILTAWEFLFVLGGFVLGKFIF